MSTIPNDPTSKAILTAVSGILERSATFAQHTELGAALRSVPVVSAFERRYDGDPREALLARYDDWQQFDHFDAVAELVETLGVAEVWSTMLTYTGRYSWKDNPAAPIIRLIDSKLLPADESIFVHGARHPEALAAVFDHLHLRNLRVFAPALVVSHIIARDLPLKQFQAHLGRLWQIDDTAVVDSIVAHTAHRVGLGDELVGTERHARVLAETQLQRLIERGGDADWFTIAALQGTHTLSDHMDDLLGLMVRTPAGTAAALAMFNEPREGFAGSFAIDALLHSAVTTHMGGTRRDEFLALLNRDVARNLLRGQWVSPATLVPLAAQHPTWKLHSDIQTTAAKLGNETAIDTVAALVAHGLLSGDGVFFAVRQVGPEALAPAVATMAGLPALILDYLAERGSSINPLPVYELEPVLALVDTLLDSDTELWQRFLTAGETSMFRNREHSFSSAVAVLRERWAEAASRRNR